MVEAVGRAVPGETSARHQQGPVETETESVDRSRAATAPLVLDADDLRRRVGRVSAAAVVALIVLHLAATGIGTGAPVPPGGTGLGETAARLFRLDRELSVPTWWASMSWLLAAARAALVAQRAGPHRRRWAVLATAFCLLSVEELAAPYEELSLPYREALAFQGALSYVWILPYLVLGAACAAVVWPAVRALPARRQRPLVGAGLVFIAGAVGVELVAAVLARRGLAESLAYESATTVEELFELAGVALFITALLGCLADPVAGAPATVDATRLRRWFLWSTVPAVALLALLHVGSVAVTFGDAVAASAGRGAFARQFSMNEEMNLSTWVNAGLLGMAALSLALLGRHAAVTRAPFVRQWYGLAGVFAFVSLDESTSLHEALITPVREGLSLSGVLTYAWVVPYSVLCVVGAVVIWPWLRALPRRTAAVAVLAGAVFVGGAVGGELLQGGLFSAGLRDSPGYVLAAMAEEVMEMTGVILFVAALLRLLSRRTSALVVGR